MSITTILAHRRSVENTDRLGDVCGTTTWTEYTLPATPGATPETFFVSEAYCRLVDNYGLSGTQASTALAIADDHGRVDLAI